MQKIWMLYGNPKYFAKRSFLKRPSIYWFVNRYTEAMALGDQTVLWESGPAGGVVGYGVVIEVPVTRCAVAVPENLGYVLWQSAVPDPESSVVGIRQLAAVHTGLSVCCVCRRRACNAVQSLSLWWCCSRVCKC